MRRSFLAVSIVPALAAFAFVTFAQTKEAAAGPTLDLDLNLGTAIQSPGVANASSRIDFSLGGGAALGYRFHLGPWLYLQPEVGGHYMRFGFNSQDIGYDYAGTLNGGLRLGLSGVVQPNVFGHVGAGFLGYNTVVGTRPATVFELGPEMDLGLGLDFRLLPGFTLGAQVAYNTAVVPSPAATVGPAGDYAAKWFSFGIKAGFQFGEPRRVVYVQRY
jgi:hypothetical protein